ncbi:uncharacterized protein LOC119829791 [Zerene cesonia]|uniref:uncharacterized protein LOC119829791 n=1 Tax=Zerene cesonia TaxID=33412 RepID=UPI0018E5A290|nr:uncharacterized protein LOC119829791 [Zerene cesonia]
MLGPLTYEMVIQSSKYEVVNTMLSSFESRMSLVIRRLTDADLGGYRCIAKNSLGEVDGSIRVYGIAQQLIKNTSPSSRNEDFSSPMEGPDNQFGSAERSDDEDDRESVTEYSDKVQITTHNSSPKNKSFYSTNNLEKQNVNNKVQKVNNLEAFNNACNLKSITYYLFLFIFYL